MPIDYAGLSRRAFRDPLAGRAPLHQIAGQKEGDDILDAMEAKRLAGEREGYQQNLDAMGALEKLYGSPSLVRTEGNNFGTSSGTMTRAGRKFAMESPERQSAANETIDNASRLYQETEGQTALARLEAEMMGKETQAREQSERQQRAQEAQNVRAQFTQASQTARTGKGAAKKRAMDDVVRLQTLMGLSTNPNVPTMQPSHAGVGNSGRTFSQSQPNMGGIVPPRTSVAGIDAQAVRAAIESKFPGKQFNDAFLQRVMSDPESLAELGLR